MISDPNISFERLTSMLDTAEKGNSEFKGKYMETEAEKVKNNI